jgi:thioester reductase-like protein
MPERPGVLLTGGTGLLGQYLLPNLLLNNHPVTVLARDSPREQAAERIARLLAFWSERLHRKLPAPVVLSGDLNQDALGLTYLDRCWIQRQCRAVIHSAANLSFRETLDGEPWRTNVEGTRALLALCRDVGLAEWHQVSTAFVFGRRTGLLSEEDVDLSQSFHNIYEESKAHAEHLVTHTPGIRATIYRPSVIVGDSRTGHTSTFDGLYQFLQLAQRLASVHAGGPSNLQLRLPLSGNEMWNLVPVDWVARAIVELLGKPWWHGYTFHLVSRSPVTTRLLRDVGVEILNLSGVEFAGPGSVENPTRLEQLFVEGIEEYWPYLSGNPIFASANTQSALPGLPPPVVDRPLLERLINFAVACNWGRGSAPGKGKPPPRSSCADYIERTFPPQARQSRLGREAGLDLTIGVDVHGPGGGQWSCTWKSGEFQATTPGLAEDALVIYHTSTTTFHALLTGQLTPQEAFFEQQISITGDLETALKLAVLFGQFLTETTSTTQPREVMDAAPPVQL